MPRLALMVICALPAFAQKDFPEGEAREYVSRICLQCHAAAQLLSQKRTEADWRKTIARMATKGVPGTSEQYDAIIVYMVKNFPKEEDTTRLNMNKATAEELVSVIGLTASEANAL